ncbi:ABC transporter permease subunit [Halorientalis pallida]|uniref:Copper ABC transporter permease n=1 Tax=Halorientalis pallida TaxID=2479928 RepID=A0A498L0H3_9EURY|nr:ABC transporter permease subunit [Halorientalis pallida]RXK49223.1 copper ABC transporter permease [Halorientalis pallida]
MTRAHVLAVAQREFATVFRTRLLVVLSVGFVGLIAGVAWLGASPAYLALSFDLLTPLEALVPVLAFAFGYRALLGDRERGELARLRTYPLDHRLYVLGVYLGRAVGLLGVVLVGLSTAALVVPLTGTESLTAVAIYGTVDSPALFLRFLILTAVFALVALALALLVSAAVRSTWNGLALATGAVLALVVGLDGALVGTVTATLPAPDVTATLLALSPTSAYRSLAFALVFAPGGVTVSGGSTAVIGALALGSWFVGSLALTGVLVRR